MNKLGAGTLAIGVDSAFSGNATVSAGSLVVNSGVNLAGVGSVNVTGGKLQVDGTLNSSGGVAVESNGILAGHGVIIDDVTINSGGAVSPGNSVGTQTVQGNETWNSGGAYLFELAAVMAPAGTHWDLLDVTGTLTINATAAAPFTISVIPLADPNNNVAGAIPTWDMLNDYQWLFVTAGQIDLVGGDPLASRFQFDLSSFNSFHSYPGLTVANFSVEQLSGNLYISYTAVPEPGSLTLVGLASSALAGYCYRRRRLTPGPRKPAEDQPANAT